MKKIFLLLLISINANAQVPTYEDSVILFTNTEELRSNLIKNHYKITTKDDAGTFWLLEEWQIIDAANHNNIPPKGMKDRGRYKVGAAKIGNLYRVYDFYFGRINDSLGYQYFSTIIRPCKIEIWQRRNPMDARLVYNYKNAKPVGYDNKNSKSVEYTKKPIIGIYPNPNDLTLRIKTPVKINVNIINPDGEIVIKEKRTNINVSSLTDGLLYTIMIYDKNNILLKESKFIKEK